MSAQQDPDPHHAPFNGAMLALAREARGMSQVALAEATDLSQGFVSKVEAGLSEMSPTTEAEVAKVLRVTPGFFHKPGQIAGPGVGCHFRRRQAATVGQLRLLQARMNIARIRYEDMLRGVEAEHAHEFIRLDVEDFDDSPEEVASQLRRAWNVPYGPIRNLTELIENAGGLIVKESFGVDRVDEMCQWLHGHQPFFYMNADMPVDRYRWSLAHGLGHVVMHHYPVAEVDLEDQANRFAGEFLAPASEIGADLQNLTMQQLGPLKMRWGIAMQAIVMRAYHLGTITDRQRKSFFIRFGKLGYRKNEPYPLPEEQPQMLRELIEFQLKENEYSVEELAGLAGAPVPIFRRTYLGQDERQPNEGAPRLRAI